MPNPNNPKQLMRLRRAMEYSRYKLQPFRERHKEAVEQSVGVYYSDSGAKKPVHVNLMELAANIYERQLVSKPPQVNVFSRRDGVSTAAERLESVVNDQLRRYDVHKELRRAVRSALFSIGIIKVGQSFEGTYEVDGYEIDKNTPFVSHILLDDWVHDMTARVMEECSFQGHRYLMDLDDAKSNKEFKRNIRSKLKAGDLSNYNEGGDERISSLTSDGTMLQERYIDKVELWEVWIPKSKLLVTLGPNEGDPPLRVVEWEGPEDGPFHTLFFNEVDGNSMPLAPAMLWQGLHKIVNGLYRKLDRQAQRQKTVGIVRGHDTEDGDRLRKASDGDVVSISGGQPIEEVSTGGINQQNFAFMLQSKELFSWLAGNLDALGGLGAQSQTLGQDQLLFSSANQRVAGMQDAVRLFTKDVVSDFAYYLWNDPLEEYPAEIQMGEFEPLKTSLRPEQREKPFFEYELDVEPYSMQFQSPGQRLQTLNQVVQSVIMPAMPLMQQQGLGLDMGALLRIYSQYSNMPELNEIVTQQGQPPEQGMGRDQESQGRPPVTHRTNERISRPGSTRAGGEQVLINNLMGNRMQGSEQDAAARQMGGA